LNGGLAIANPDHFVTGLLSVKLQQESVSATQIMFDAGKQGAAEAKAAGDGVLGEEIAVGGYSGNAHQDGRRHAGFSSSIHNFIIEQVG
jgi:ATP-dependent Clp protease adapter protein ClpS